jgi:hypothetical protein
MPTRKPPLEISHADDLPRDLHEIIEASVTVVMSEDGAVQSLNVDKELLTIKLIMYIVGRDHMIHEHGIRIGKGIK